MQLRTQGRQLQRIANQNLRAMPTMWNAPVMMHDFGFSFSRFSLVRLAPWRLADVPS
jgi:hypothetical protein